MTSIYAYLRDLKECPPPHPSPSPQFPNIKQNAIMKPKAYILRRSGSEETMGLSSVPRYRWTITIVGSDSQSVFRYVPYVYNLAMFVAVKDILSHISSLELFYLVNLARLE